MSISNFSEKIISCFCCYCLYRALGGTVFPFYSILNFTLRRPVDGQATNSFSFSPRLLPHVSVKLQLWSSEALISINLPGHQIYWFLTSKLFAYWLPSGRPKRWCHCQLPYDSMTILIECYQVNMKRKRRQFTGIVIVDLCL